MDVMQEVLAHVLSQERLVLSLLDWDPRELGEAANQVAMEALEQIATALSDESHSDENCVDHILYILRGIGISCGNCHHIPVWDE